VALVAENMERILTSPSYSLAQDDRELLTREEMRGVRMLLELGKPEIALQADNIKSTVIVFGGTQIVDRSAAERRLFEARRAAQATPSDRAWMGSPARWSGPSGCSRCAATTTTPAPSPGSCRSTTSARTNATTWSSPEAVPGIMEAANRGAFDVGCKSIGLNIKLPAEQQPNPFITPELCFQFKYFALRKFHFILRAAAVVLFPGGFGTLDEMFETLTLRQTHRMQPVPIILYGRDYWSKVIDFQFLADSGVIADRHLELFSYAETPEEAWQQILDFHAKKQTA
jgi:uncharacterized protein (TIGR00730 family)